MKTTLLALFSVLAIGISASNPRANSPADKACREDSIRAVIYAAPDCAALKGIHQDIQQFCPWSLVEVQADLTEQERRLCD